MTQTEQEMLNPMIHKDLSLRENGRLSRYLVFSRQQWAQLRDTTPLTLSEESGFFVSDFFDYTIYSQ